ncbi:MAG TPA: hypothetical protein VKR61_11075 [Bryobacteraceae bacterium]|nr:hypothetical protein [Bryobacteraceae bacterium]
MLESCGLAAFFNLQAQVNVTTFHNDNARDGQNLSEYVLTPANVGSSQFGQLFVQPVDGNVYAQPLYVSNVQIAGATHNVVYLVTEHDSVYAFDADSNSGPNAGPLWHVSFINPAAGVTTVNSQNDLNCPNIAPEVGITGTPAIDLSSNTLYVVAKTKENNTFVQRLHALDITSGVEKFGGPVMIQAVVPGTGAGSSGGQVTFDPQWENQRSGLFLLNGMVYIGWAAHCDIPPYHGWMMAYDAQSLQQVAVWNATPNGSDGGVWQSGAAPAVDTAGNIYLATGNGTFDLNTDGRDAGDSVLRFGAPGSGVGIPILDYFTPYNQATLSVEDADLGSGGVILLPDQPPGSPHQHLLVEIDKEGSVYLINRDNMGHFNAANNIQIVQWLPQILGGLWGTPAFWNNRFYVGARNDSLQAFLFNANNAGMLSTSPISASQNTFYYPGTTPSISANGDTNAIVWALDVGNNSAILHAYDATNLATELYNSTQNGPPPGPSINFIVPTIANGKVFVGTATQLAVYGLLTNRVTITSSPSGASLTLAGTGCVPGIYTTPAYLTWSAGVSCTINFTDPQKIAGMEYEFQSSGVNGSAVSHANPQILYYGGGTMLINATFGVVSGTGPGTAQHFSVVAPSVATAGTPVQFTVTALDGSGHMVTTYTDPVHFASTDPAAVLPGDAVLTNGVGTFSAALLTAGVVTLTASDLLWPAIAGTSGGIAVSQSTAGLRFVTMPPCRLVDTRDNLKPGGFGPPSISGGASRSFAIPDGPCAGIPAAAQAYSLNVTVVPHGELSYLTVWPTGQSQPLVSTLNSLDGRIKANAAVISAGTAGAISVFATNNMDLVLDIDGYFVPASDSAALAFYPMTPCRLVDTRPGAPSTIITGRLAANSTTTLPIPSSSCQVPSAAQAYSLNFTLVPPGPVAYLTVWPTGQSQPIVSTLNDLTGTIVANAAITPVGTEGDIDVFVTGATDLVVDINGYFAPASTAGLSLYTLPPCRVLDTRMPPGSPPFTGAINVNVEASGCGGTGAALGYVLNASVVPAGLLGYLTLWPQGSPQPVASTLNALDGAITSNMAIVPTGNTEVSAFAAANTYLILDLFGYFAP